MTDKKLQEMPIGDRMRSADAFGTQTAVIINTAIKKINKLLKPHGYSVSVDLKFHELEQETKSQS